KKKSPGEYVNIEFG
nr:Chain B, insulin receptor substrate 1 [synthetic construct]